MKLQTKENWEKLKKCTQCGKDKPLSDFYKKLNDHHPYCKECYKKYDVKRYYTHRKDRLKKDNKRYSKNKEKYIQESLRMKEKYPNKWKTRQTLRNAVHQGKIIKLPCQICGNSKSNGHHPDYDKPLEVIWLCGECHHKLHRIYDENNLTKNYVRKK